MKEKRKYLNPKDFYSHYMVTYNPKVPKIGWKTIKVLEFLNNKPWDEVALAYVHALRPSSIRVTTGGIYLDARVWRVTVYVDDNDIIQSITQEVEVALPEKVCHGWCLEDALKYGIDSEQVKWHNLESDINGIITGNCGTYKYVNNKKVNYPKELK